MSISIKSIYVGNLPFKMKRDEVRELFEPYGEVYSVKLINDRETGRPKGFGFVEMDAENVDKAVDALHGQDCLGRTLTVSGARERKNEQMPAQA